MAIVDRSPFEGLHNAVDTHLKGSPRFAAPQVAGLSAALTAALEAACDAGLVAAAAEEVLRRAIARFEADHAPEFWSTVLAAGPSCADVLVPALERLDAAVAILARMLQAVELHMQAARPGRLRVPERLVLAGLPVRLRRTVAASLLLHGWPREDFKGKCSTG
jgi:hypothetical protein